MSGSKSVPNIYVCIRKADSIFAIDESLSFSTPNFHLVLGALSRSSSWFKGSCCTRQESVGGCVKDWALEESRESRSPLTMAPASNSGREGRLPNSHRKQGGSVAHHGQVTQVFRQSEPLYRTRNRSRQLGGKGGNVSCIDHSAAESGLETGSSEKGVTIASETGQDGPFAS